MLIFSPQISGLSTQHNWGRKPILFSLLYLSADSPVERTHPLRSSQLIVQCPVLLSALQLTCCGSLGKVLNLLCTLSSLFFNKEYSNPNISLHWGAETAMTITFRHKNVWLEFQNPNDNCLLQQKHGLWFPLNLMDSLPTLPFLTASFFFLYQNPYSLAWHDSSTANEFLSSIHPPLSSPIILFILDISRRVYLFALP